jgi:hypothetical protein
VIGSDIGFGERGMSRVNDRKARFVLTGLASFTLLATVAILISRATGGKLRSESPVTAPIQGEASSKGIVAPGNTELRVLLEGGRFDAAFALYRGSDTDCLEAADLVALGLPLLDRDRLVLSWAALEAAHRIDPQNARCIQTLDKLHAKLALAKGRERLALHDAASRVEFLSTVPGGQPLGSVVLGLAGSADDAAQAQDFLDRLAIRDRSVLRRVVSARDAVKLVARLLMESGQPRKARDLLEPLVSAGRSTRHTAQENGTQSPKELPDREAAWLLSRAALQLDHDDIADAMLALAADFSQGPLPPSEPAPFVGSKRCRDCHRFFYGQQQRFSRHSRTLAVRTGLKDIPLPSEAIADPHCGALSHSFTRVSDGRIEVSSRLENRVVKGIVEYAIGSGRHGITMVAKDERGIDRELRISYFGEGEAWGETKGITTAPRDPDDQIGLALAPKPLRHCLHCHSTWFGGVDQGRSVPSGPEALDHGIGCERCHGPGLNHLKAVESGFAQVAIALSATSPPSAKLQSCIECHASDGSIEPSDPEFTRAQGTTLLFSRCYTMSGGQLGCTTCHDPHRALDRTISHYETKCLHCHETPPPRTAQGPVRSIAATDDTRSFRSQSCPVNPAADCISCHMPKVETGDRHSRFTDHHIRVHRG